MDDGRILGQFLNPVFKDMESEGRSRHLASTGVGEDHQPQALQKEDKLGAPYGVESAGQIGWPDGTMGKKERQEKGIDRGDECHDLVGGYPSISPEVCSESL